MELEHSYFNFIPMIRKIKIDKFTGRKANPSSATDYLEQAGGRGCRASDFDNIEDIFLADLINR